MLFTPEGIDLSEVSQRRQGAFLFQAQHHVYPVDRGIDSYNYLLPKFNNIKVTQHIDSRIDAGARELRVLDIGCGRGVFLASLARKHPEVRAFGISAYDYRPRDKFSEGLLSEIDYRVGDGNKLKEVFADTQFDIITSLYALQYFADPLNVIAQAYECASEGGLLLFDEFGPRMTIEQVELLRKYWEKEGIQAELDRWVPSYEKFEPARYALAVQKGTSVSLPLPFRYSLPDDPGIINFNYFFDETVARS